MTSASTPNYALLEEGTFGSSTGLYTSDPGDADIQIFTKEGGISLENLGRKLKVAEILSETNGFHNNAQYNAEYLTIDANDNYIGASIQRLTTDGNFYTSISSLGLDTAVNSNLNVGATNAFPVERTIMASPLEISTAAGASFTFEASSGMMAGNIATALNQEGAQYGLRAGGI